MTAKKNPPIPFEAALADLESLVGQLEHGELALEDSLQQFERCLLYTSDAADE